MAFSVWLWSIYPMHTYVANFFLYEMKKSALSSNFSSAKSHIFFLSFSLHPNKPTRKKEKNKRRYLMLVHERSIIMKFDI